MKRALALLLILLLLASPAAAFWDVADDAWYAPAVASVQDKGIMTGVGDGRFDPDGIVTRGTMAAVIHRMAGSPFSGAPQYFVDDMRAGMWHADAVIWCADKGIITGVDETHFCPNDPVTREQAALMLWRFAGWPQTKPAYFADSYKINWWSKLGVDWAAQTGIVTGKPDGLFDPQGPTTRAELAQMVTRFTTWKQAQAG